MPRLFAQLGRFGAVGLVGLVVDITLFNLLRATVLSPEELDAGPIIAKIVSASVAIAVNWMGSRYWTFRLERRRPALREAVEFVLVSMGGLVIAVTCLAVSRELLGFTSVLADNIASNVIGLGLGSLFRFTLYRWWVFHPRRGPGRRRRGSDPQAPGTGDGTGDGGRSAPAEPSVG